jgi:hypothetical protein
LSESKSYAFVQIKFRRKKKNANAKR